MLKSKVFKLVDFFTPEGSCECCGISCKTALCNTCREELLEEIPEESQLVESEALEADQQKLSA